MRIQTENMSLNLNDDGTLELKAGLLNGCFRPGISLDGTPLPMEAFSVSEQSASHFVLSGGNSRCMWKFHCSASLGKIRLRLTASLAEHARKIELIPYSLPRICPEHFLAQNLKMGGCVSLHFPRTEKSVFEGHHFAVIKGSGCFVMVSAPLRNRFMTDFKGTAFGSAVTDFKCSAGTIHEDILEIDSGEFTFIAGSDPFSLMDLWSDENLGIKKDFSRPPVCGWNSWDYYRWTVTEEEVLQNAEFIARDPVLSKHVKRIIVDDGWQYCYGEWDANPLFPNGLKYLADELKKMGFDPGLWVAPSIAEPHSRIAQLNPQETMGLGENGLPCLAYECMRRYGFVLDPTVEKSRQFVRDTFRRLSGYGFCYFKLDFLCSTLAARQFHDRTVSRTDIVRRFVEDASAGTAGRSVILGCNYSFASGNQFVDSVRVGGDIHARWDCIRHNSVSVAGTMWSAEKYWINDPDFALCRALDTTDDPQLQAIRALAVFNAPDSEYSDNFIGYTLADAKRAQMEVLLSLILVSAGAINLSDKIPLLNESGLELARKTVSAEHGKPGRPVDLFEDDYAALWIQKTPSGHRVLQINWTESEKAVSFDLKSYGISAEKARSFWNDSTVDISSGKIEAVLPGRSCLLTELQ